jgi:cytosine permease
MSQESTTTPTSLPDYITSATPNPASNRAPWYKNTAPTYAGIFLWFVFWQDAAVAPNLGGILAGGVAWALASLVVAGLVCHFFFYLVPALLGQKTGLPLYIVGTSTYGARGGFLMPGFLMGLLQFGWLGVNTFFSSVLLSQVIPLPPRVIMVIWGLLAAFVGLKGIQYVGRVATYLPLIPLAILLVLFVKTVGSVGGLEPIKLFEAHRAVVPDAPPALSALGVLAFVLTYVVGFFATAGAAGVDFGANARDGRDVKMGGLVGIAGATILTAGLSALVVAGVYGSADMAVKAVDRGQELGAFVLNSVNLIPVILGETAFKWMSFLLALAAFPAACFSSFIAANSFKTTLPRVNPFISVGIGAAVSIVLAVTGLAGDVVPVFVIIGASFGPICGAMFVDYLMNNKTWTGPRKGFNPAGWIAWAVGFVIGILPNLGVALPAAPVLAFVAGALIYWLCAKVGLLSPVIPYSGAKG